MPEKFALGDRGDVWSSCADSLTGSPEPNRYCISEYIPRVLRWLGILGAGGMSGYAAHLTEQLHAYAPVSWVFAALLGALIVSVMFAFVAWARALWNRTLFFARMTASTPSVNPLDDHS